MDLTKEYSVSEVVDKIQFLIEKNFYYVKVIGEISGIRKSSNGHIYFNLKDARSLIGVVVFKTNIGSLVLEEGMKIKLFGKLSIYRDRSSYQIISEKIEVQGEGTLLKIFEERLAKLRRAGLFALEHKRPIPEKIKFIGIITAKNGAAIKDIEVRLRERKPIEVVLFPALVQGMEAPREIIKGINYFNALSKKPDVIVITRGGGSIEDLMCFNDEELAYAIYDSQLPIISAVGHEIDYTIADYVADKRLPTPTSVAEFIVKSKTQLIQEIDNLLLRIRHIVFTILRRRFVRYGIVINKYKVLKKNHKKRILERKHERLYSIFKKIVKCLLRRNIKKRRRIKVLWSKFGKHNGDYFLKKGIPLVEYNGHILNKNMKVKIKDKLEIRFVNKIIKAEITEIIDR